jgi:hypothetical protein
LNTTICPSGSSTRTRTRACLLLLAAFGSISIACGDDDPSPADDAGSDAATSDADVSPDAAPSGSGAWFGPCESNAQCPNGTFCDPEIEGSLELPGAPGGMLDQSLFPGGSCSPKPLAPFDSTASCDSSLPQPAQGCGPDGACVLESLNMETYAACRPACEPSAAASGCEREGYTCDFGLKACVEGCRSDAACRLIVQDNNGDGQADAVAYDTDSSAFCDEQTQRCEHPGSASVPVGSSCQRLDDCEADGACLEGQGALGGLDFPGGYCTKVGCDVDGRECQGGAVCEPLRPLLGTATSAPLCFARCEVGAEPPELRTGARSHGVGCREGYRCHYNGGSGAMSGVCVGGVYNDVTRNNIGEACTADSECYSPFGLAVCLTYSATDAMIRTPRGTCSLLDCAAPGLPDDVCGSGNECIPFSGDLTFCIHNCSTAMDCAAGYACTDEDADASTAKICFPACLRNADCKQGEVCQAAQGASAGRCVAMGG